MKKWRNKITGEINDFIVHKRIEDSEDGNPVYAPFDGNIDEWEDYGEPKGKALYWMILTLENFIENEPNVEWIDLEDCKQLLEKLKAWQRLEDKGIEFYGWRKNQTGTYDFLARWKDVPPKMHDIINDLDLLFGGEE